MANDVTYERPEFTAYAKRAALVDDVVENKLKEKGDAYLPRPNPTDKSAENTTRYDQYKERAVVVNFTGNTLRGLVGAAFTKEPELQIPDAFWFVEKNVDGEGVGLNQQARKVVGRVLRSGRHALFVDYPKVEGNITLEQQKSQGIRPKIISIDARRVINWKTKTIGGESKLSLVVFRSDHEEDDGFGVKVIEQYIVLRLDDVGYKVEWWRREGEKSGKWVLFDEDYPKNNKGQNWKQIPFIFPGAENNDPGVDDSPLYDMAQVNIAHYRNSADYEDSAYFCGQVQPWVTGVDESWVAFMKKEGMTSVGSRQLMAFPQNANFGLAQATANTMVKEAMDSKEKQMAAIGARIITPGTAPKTATEAEQDNEVEHSVLSLVVSNVSEAYEQCFLWMAEFIKAEVSEVVYKINQEFIRRHIDAQMLQALISAWMSGQYPASDFWAQLRKYGLIAEDKTDDEILDELESSSDGLGLDEVTVPDEEDNSAA